MALLWCKKSKCNLSEWFSTLCYWFLRNNVLLLRLYLNPCFWFVQNNGRHSFSHTYNNYFISEWSVVKCKKKTDINFLNRSLSLLSGYGGYIVPITFLDLLGNRTSNCSVVLIYAVCGQELCMTGVTVAIELITPSWRTHTSTCCCFSFTLCES